MKKVKHVKSAKGKIQHEKKCNMEIMQFDQSPTIKQCNIKKGNMKKTQR